MEQVTQLFLYEFCQTVLTECMSTIVKHPLPSKRFFILTNRAPKMSTLIVVFLNKFIRLYLLMIFSSINSVIN